MFIWKLSQRHIYSPKIIKAYYKYILCYTLIAKFHYYRLEFEVKLVHLGGSKRNSPPGGFSSIWQFSKTYTPSEQHHSDALLVLKSLVHVIFNFAPVISCILTLIQLSSQGRVCHLLRQVPEAEDKCFHLAVLRTAICDPARQPMISVA